MKNRPRSIFDIIFGNRDDFFSDFSHREDLFNQFFSKSSFGEINDMSSSEFPSDDDANFNKTEENIDTETHTIRKEKWVSIDGSQMFERTTTQSKSTPKEKAINKKEDIKLLMDKAVEEQNFEEAARLRDLLKNKEK